MEQNNKNNNGYKVVEKNQNKKPMSHILIFILITILILNFIISIAGNIFYREGRVETPNVIYQEGVIYSEDEIYTNNCILNEEYISEDEIEYTFSNLESINLELDNSEIKIVENKKYDDKIYLNIKSDDPSNVIVESYDNSLSVRNIESDNDDDEIILYLSNDIVLNSLFLQSGENKVKLEDVKINTVYIDNLNEKIEIDKSEINSLNLNTIKGEIEIYESDIKDILAISTKGKMDIELKNRDFKIIDLQSEEGKITLEIPEDTYISYWSYDNVDEDIEVTIDKNSGNEVYIKTKNKIEIKYD